MKSMLRIGAACRSRASTHGATSRGGGLIVPLALSTLLLSPAFAQSGSAATANKPCSWLTKEMVAKASGKQPTTKPEEVNLGGSGSACQWGDLMVKVDPFPAARIDQLSQSSPKDWETISGLGDAAYFHNVKDAVAELFVRVGPRTLGILMDVPVNEKAAAVKPRMVEVARAIVPKLR